MSFRFVSAARAKTRFKLMVMCGALMAPVTVLAQTGKWSVVGATNTPIPREECAFAQAGGKFYLLGGRGIQPVQEYSPATKTWKNLKNTPTIFNHFQALTSAGLIYVIGAFDESLAGFPDETPAPNIYVYDPLSDTWVKGPAIPKDRQRGSAGLVDYQGKFYVALGNKLGHTGNGVVFLDEFDPTTNAWNPLGDAPRSRDHFQAVVVGDKLYALGGRHSASPAAPIFTDLEKVDVYDFTTSAWSTLPSPGCDLKVKRSGGIIAAMGDEIIFAGGSNPAVFTTGAYNLTDAFNTTTSTWRSLAPMNTGRQVAGGFVNNTGFYVASGSGGTGGSPTLTSMEVFFMKDSLAPGGDPLVAGQLASTEASFNFGIVASGQTQNRTLTLRHASGTQGVLIQGFKIVGDPAFQVKTVVAAPYLVRPGTMSTVDLAFVSQGTIPADSYLEVTLAVPPGATLKVPLEANKNALAVFAPSRAAAASPVAVGSGRYWDGGWLFGERPELHDLRGRENHAVPKVREIPQGVKRD